MDANIYLAKSIIDGYRNHQFKRIYPFATENVAGCFSGYDFKDKDCLTVLGSSVQALYMYLMGAKKVTTFDINPLAIYYLHFQKAFFLSKMKFKDYKNMFHAFSFEDTKDTYNLDKYYKKISECLDGKYKVFWDTLYDEYGSYLFNTNGLFNPIECSCGSIDKYMGIYSSSNIRKLRSSIEYFEPEFINCNITELHKYLCQGYDFMYFSNIMQYSKSVFNSCDLKESLYKYKDLLISFKDLLNSGGSIYGSYIYGIDYINNVFVNSIDRVYPFATENVGACLSSYDFNNKDCLTVLGSGLQALYMFMKGAKSVCAFDVNSLSIYYYEFLKAFIKSGLDFSSYRKLFIKSFGNKDNTYKQILDYMDGDYRNYFKVLYDKYGSSILSNRKLFNTVVISKYGCVKYNDIFRKENLEVLRSKINDFDFKFINSDINNLVLDRSYDFMYFSNIMQYVSEMYNDNMINSLSKYRELLLKFKELLNKGGSMYASYIYGIDLLAIPNMDAFCLASIGHVFEHDLIEYKSFNAFKINFSAFIEGASKDGVLVYSK